MDEPPTPEQVRGLRKAAMLTLREAAALVGVTLVTWARWEKGAHPMPRAAWELAKIRMPERQD